MQTTRPLRRHEASQYLAERGVQCAPKTLAKLAVIGGGPAFRKAGHFPVYDPTDLDSYAAEKIGPLVRSTSEHREFLRVKEITTA